MPNEHQSLRVRGRITAETRDAATGRLIPDESCTVDNIVVDLGLEAIAALMAQLSYSTGFEIAVGTGSTTPAAGDTDLATNVHQAAVTSQTAVGALARFTLFIDTTQANGNTLTEAGLFFDSDLVDRALLSSSIVKTSSKTVTVTIEITFSR